jgi:hypothetical protein
MPQKTTLWIMCPTTHIMIYTYKRMQANAAYDGTQLNGVKKLLNFILSINI